MPHMVPAAVASHTHVESDITDLPNHTHVSADITDLDAGGASLVVLDTNRTTTSIASDVTGLSFALAESTEYMFQFKVWWESTGAGTSIQLGLNGPSSPTLVRYTVRIGEDTGSPVDWIKTFSYESFGNRLTATNPGGSNKVMPAWITGYVNTSSGNSGTLIPEFRNETGSATITIHAGSFGQLWTV